MDPDFFSPAPLCITESGRAWLDAYDLKYPAATVESFFARDVWAEILRTLLRGPASRNEITNAFDGTRLMRVIPRTDIRKAIELLIELEYIEVQQRD